MRRRSHHIIALLLLLVVVLPVSAAWALDLLPSLWGRKTATSTGASSPETTSTPATSKDDGGTVLHYESFAISQHEAGAASSVASSFHNWLNKKLEESPTHPSCWKKARLAMNGTCRAFTHEANQRLALSLTSCHLQEAGRKPLGCPASHGVSRCLQSLDDYRLHLYTEFFNSVKQTCLALQAEIWQAQMDATVQELGARTVITVDLLGKQARMQSDILMNQLQSLDNEAKLAEEQREIGRGIQEIAEINMKLRDDMQELEERVHTASQRLQYLSQKLEKAYEAEESRISSITRNVDHLLHGWTVIGAIWQSARSGIFVLVLLAFIFPLTGPALVRPYRPWITCIWAVWALHYLIWPSLSPALAALAAEVQMWWGFPIVLSLLQAVVVMSLALGLFVLALPHATPYVMETLRRRKKSMKEQGGEYPPSAGHHQHPQEHQVVQYKAQQQQQQHQHQHQHQPAYYPPPSPQRHPIATQYHPQPPAAAAAAERHIYNNNWSMSQLTAAELSRWPRRDLQHLAMRTGCCAGNAKTNTLIDAILKYARDTT